MSDTTWYVTCKNCGNNEEFTMEFNKGKNRLRCGKCDCLLNFEGKVIDNLNKQERKDLEFEENRKKYHNKCGGQNVVRVPDVV